MRNANLFVPLGTLLVATACTAVAEETPRELPAVDVRAGPEQPDGYRGTATRVGKVLQDPHDIPQAVTTLTSGLLDEQQAGSLREALRNVSGMSFNAAEGGRSGDNMNLRGFYTFGDMYLDGIRDTAQYYRETFGFEQIDVLRGAGAMLFGRGQAGGVINMVSKTPLSFDQVRLTGSLGNTGYREVTGDFNKPIGAGAALRVNLMKRDEGNWRSNPESGAEPDIHRRGAALSLALNRDSRNRFWLNHYRVVTDDNPDYGVSFDAATRRPSERLPASYFWGTERSFDKSDTAITTLVNEFAFSAASELRTQLRTGRYERSYWAKTPSLTTPPAANGGIGGNPTRTSSYHTTTLQSDFSTRFAALGMKHQVITGIEILKERSYRNALQNFGGTTVANPPDFRPGSETFPGNAVAFSGDSWAIYAQDTVEFIPKWKATLGARRDSLEAEYSSVTSPRLTFGENSYRAALSFHPEADSHYYLGWSDSFSPTADLYQLTVQPQPAERSNVVELGAKWLLMDGDLALRAALYRAIKHWERNSDLESTAAILTRKRRTDGLEIEAAGRVTEAWEVFAGAALMDARILEVAENISATTGAITLANPEYAGKRARNTPRYTWNLWSTYRIGGGWKVGLGVEAKGDRHAFVPSGAGAVPMLAGSYAPNTAPSYLRWDAMLAWEMRKWTLRLNVKNLFDRLYWDSVYDNGGFAIPGPRRTVVLSGEFKF